MPASPWPGNSQPADDRGDNQPIRPTGGMVSSNTALTTPVGELAMIHGNASNADDVTQATTPSASVCEPKNPTVAGTIEADPARNQANANNQRTFLCLPCMTQAGISSDNTAAPAGHTFHAAPPAKSSPSRIHGLTCMLNGGQLIDEPLVLRLQLLILYLPLSDHGF